MSDPQFGIFQYVDCVDISIFDSMNRLVHRIPYTTLEETLDTRGYIRERIQQLFREWEETTLSELAFAWKKNVLDNVLPE